MRLSLLVVALVLLPAGAHASGGIMGGNWGGTGASAPGRAYTYIALPMDRGTLVQAVQARRRARRPLEAPEPPASACRRWRSTAR